MSVDRSPVNKLQTSLGFPNLFPDGTAYPTANNDIRSLTTSSIEEHRNSMWSHRYSAHTRFPYWAFHISYKEMCS